MAFIVDATHLGTSESSWKASKRLAAVPRLRMPSPQRMVVVTPHPDDEIFGSGGLIQAMLALRIPVSIIAVTDGEGSHPRTVSEHNFDLRTLRAKESELALTRLGWRIPQIRRLAIPDGRVEEHVDRLGDILVELLLPGDLCVAPWRSDGHPDHNACGEAAAFATGVTGADLLEFLVWAWHWAGPNGDDLPWADCRRLDLSRTVAARKRWATSAFRSQIRPLGVDRTDVPLLPAPVLRRFWRQFEVFIESGCAQ
jgi:LmbE family N-acetylglucosaminyl deacetylase